MVSLASSCRGAPRTWNDAIYAEDAKSGKRYVFVNEGDVYDAGTANPYSWVSVIDVDKKEVRLVADL